MHIDHCSDINHRGLPSPSNAKINKIKYKIPSLFIAEIEIPHIIKKLDFVLQALDKFIHMNIL